MFICGTERLGVFILAAAALIGFREPADGGKAILLALHSLAGLEQLTVSLSITHTPKPPDPTFTSPTVRPQVRAPF